VAAAVVLPNTIFENPNRLAGVDDSKQLTAKHRMSLALQIKEQAIGWGVGVVPAHIIDTHGILPATRLAMELALLRLPLVPNALLIDAVRLSNWPCHQVSLIKGDARCLSIAAASVLAKVTRDQLMTQLGQALPAYGFAEHKGYGTAAHSRALSRYGPTQHHRRTFRPICQFIETGCWPSEKENSDANST
jgi:ribonuclease HII